MTEETLFAAALEKDCRDERAAFLEHACGDDLDLRRRVEALLESHEAPEFLGTPAVVQAARSLVGDGDTEAQTADDDRAIESILLATLAHTHDERHGFLDTTCSDDPTAIGVASAGSMESESPTERPGTVIGPYKLIEQIGEGGMGTVFLAEQIAPVKRAVALKLIKPGMDSRQVLARFNAERQALALMDHANIARVLDAGATEIGRPYFVMELVKGIPITQYCDERKLTPRDRLELFIPVCQAVQHAHQKGIIHRDLKPTNVLVALYDDKPVPKVIDFGVAKATRGRLTEATLYTGYGMIVGTPEYMSPEQAEVNQLDIDTRSDIYSLGVLLYELLTGTTPLQNRRIRQAALLEVLRLVREEEAPRPSQRLSTTEELPNIAANRGIEPRRLTGLVHGDLDWIVMKALEKDRNRRYESAHTLAVDVQRYLDDEEVSACPPSRWYGLTKLVRRHRGKVLATALLALTLVTGIIGTTWGLVRADHARAEAVRETRQKETALQEKELALLDAKRSRRDADEKLLASYVDQARAQRVSRRPGQRFESLRALGKASELARELKLPQSKFLELRNDAIATLALPDIHWSVTSIVWPSDGFVADFDDSHTVYARTDKKGDCSVRRVADDVELHRLGGNGLAAWPLLSREGRFLAVMYREEGVMGLGALVHIWDLAESPPRRLVSVEMPRAVDFRPDSGTVAIGQEDGAIRVFELPSGRPLFRMPPVELTREIRIALHPTEPLAALSSYFHPVVQIRDLRTGDVIARLQQDGNPGGVSWHPEGTMLAVGLVERARIRLYDRESFQVVRTLESERTVTDVSFNHAGDRVASTGWESHVELFDLGTGRKLFAMARTSMGLRFHRDDQRMAGAIKDGKFSIYQVADGRECRTLARGKPPDAIQFFGTPAVDVDGRFVAAAMSDGFGLWDLATGAELAFVATGGATTRVEFEPSGSLLVLTGTGLVRWPIGERSHDANELDIGPPERLPLPRGGGLVRSRDGRVIATCSRAVGSDEPYAGGWILHTDRPDSATRIDAGADLGAVSISPDGRWVVTLSLNPGGLVKIWNANTGELAKQFEDRCVTCPQFSPDGRWLSTSIDGGRLFEVGSWAEGPRTNGAGILSPDGRSMAMVTGAGGIQLVDLATGAELATLEDPHEPTASPCFSADGAHVIGYAAGKTKGLRVWDLNAVRGRLAELGLDWDARALPGDPRPAAPRRAPSVQVVRGESHFDRGVELSRKRLLAEAEVELRLATKADPNHAAAHDELGSVLLDQNKVEEAIVCYRRAIELSPKNAGIHNSLGFALKITGELEDAIAWLQRAIVLDPSYIKAYENLALTLREQGRMEEALGAYRKITEIEPHCAVHANIAAWLLATCDPARLRDPGQAVALAQRAVNIDPEKGNYWNTLGVAHYRAGEWAAAVAALEKARALQGDAQVSFDGFFLAMSYRRLGDEEKSRTWYEAAIAWMDRHAPQDEELQSFRSEAEEVLRGPSGAVAPGTDDPAKIDRL